MLDVTKQTDLLHEALGETGGQVSREAVRDVLSKIAERHPDLDDAAFDGIRDQVRGTILENVSFADRAGFGFIVVADLEDSEALYREVIPQGLNVPQTAIDKLRGLGTLEKNLEISAYIILNATSFSDLENKMGAAHFGADATQFLMPLFHRLMERDSSLRDRLIGAVSELGAYKTMSGIPGLVDQYFFGNNTQPYLILNFEHAGAVPSAAAKELHEAHVTTMLSILKEHLQS